MRPADLIVFLEYGTYPEGPGVDGSDIFHNMSFLKKAEAAYGVVRNRIVTYKTIRTAFSIWQREEEDLRVKILDDVLERYF